MRREQAILQIICSAILWPWGVILVIFFREVFLVTVVFEEYKWDEQITEQKLFLWNTSKNRKLASSSSIYWILNLLDSNLSTILKMRKFPHRHDFVCVRVCVCVPLFSFPRKAFSFLITLKIEKVNKKTSNWEHWC